MSHRLLNAQSLLKIVLSVGILAVLATRLDWTALTGHAAQLSPLAWIFAMVLIAVQSALISGRWQWLMNVGKHRLDFITAVRIGFVSQLANLIFVTSVGGLLTKVGLTVKVGAPVYKAALVAAVDRAMTLFSLLLLAVIFMPRLGHFVDDTGMLDRTYLAMVAFIILLALAPITARCTRRFVTREKLHHKIIRYALRYISVLARPLRAGRLVLLSMTAQAIFFCAVFILARDLNTGLSFADILTILPFISLVAALPISIGGWGVREGAFVYGLGLLGVPIETAFLISIQVGLIGMATFLIIGIPTLLTSDLSWRSSTTGPQSRQ